MKTYYVYIMASKRNGTLYTGFTDDLIRRVWEHKTNKNKGFTSKHNVHMLVYYEYGDKPEPAIQREKMLKNWHRAWKLQLIEEHNPEWKDLYYEITEPGFRHPPE